MKNTEELTTLAKQLYEKNSKDAPEEPDVLAHGQTKYKEDTSCIMDEPVLRLLKTANNMRAMNLIQEMWETYSHGVPWDADECAWLMREILDERNRLVQIEYDMKHKGVVGE